MTRMTKNERFANIVADLKILHDAAPQGSNEQHQWKIAMQTVSAARSFAEGKLSQGLTQAREAASATAGH